MAKGVILLNMGAARNPKELKQFLYNMFSDKRIVPGIWRYLLAPLISRFRYKKVWQNYRLIGGSRLYEHTRKVAEKLSLETGLQVTYAMRYTRPFINEVIHQFEEVILLPLYPQYSTTTIQSSIDDVKSTNYKGKIHIIKPFYKQEQFNKMIADLILNEIDNPEDWHLIFSAHGLPQKIIDKGDPYRQQLQEQVKILNMYLPEFKSVELAFQSRFGKSRWLQPYLENVLTKHKGNKVVVYPISFMIDNAETDLELKIEYARMADNIGIKTYKVIDCPNDQVKNIRFLSQLIKTKI